MRAFLIVCAATLSGCVGGQATDSGCITYATQRPAMPTLNADAVGRWVDVLDGAMTATCR